uniref:Helicase-associated domain-containing protein n=1 Tax=viral metagenome TaxID=1070528 RepID=A0A6C0H9B4_9ZZZZ
MDNVIIWINKLLEVKEYIDKNNKKPSQYNKSNHEVKILGRWLNTQRQNFLKKKYLMNDERIYNKWIEFITYYKDYFKEYFKNQNTDTLLWYNKLEIVKTYIDQNKRSPSTVSKDNNIKKLGLWIILQQRNYIKKKSLMLNNNIYNKWTEFINNYKNYFGYNIVVWLEKYNELIHFIELNHKLPDRNIQDNNKILYIWLLKQQDYYINTKNIMKDIDIYNKWTEFITNYKDYFNNDKLIWLDKLTEVCKYIDIYKKKPSMHSNNIHIKKLGIWINQQYHIYLKKKTSQFIWDSHIHNKWNAFLNNYKTYFDTNYVIWTTKYIEAEQYISMYNKLPSLSDKDIYIKKLSFWIYNQEYKYYRKRYIMKNTKIYNMWTEFKNKYNICFKNNIIKSLDS